MRIRPFLRRLDVPLYAFGLRRASSHALFIFRSVTLIKPMLFGMGFFIAIFIAIARCANRTGGPRVPALRWSGLRCMVRTVRKPRCFAADFHSTEIFRNSFLQLSRAHACGSQGKATTSGNKPNLDDMKLPELKELAKQMGLRGVSTMRKTELIATLQAARSGGQAPAGVTVRAPKSAPPQTLRSNRQRTRRPMKPGGTPRPCQAGQVRGILRSRGCRGSGGRVEAER